MERVVSTRRDQHHDPILRWTLIGDAIVVAATGLLMFAAAGRLSDWLDLPIDLLRWPGLFLLVYAALVGWYANQPAYSRRAISILIAVNLGWAIGCLLLLAIGDINPNWLGTGFVLLNAAACIVVAALELSRLPD